MAVSDGITSLIDILNDPELGLADDDREVIEEALGTLYEYDDRT